MTEVTIAALQIPMARFTLKIREPGIVRHLAFERKEKLIMLGGRPEFEEVLIAFVEAAKNAPIREHEFAVIEPGGLVEVDDGKRAEWRATNISQGGRAFHLFEIVEAAS